MRMRQYICHTDHNIWDIIVNRDLAEEAPPAREQSAPPPKTAKQLTARRNQERVKSILLLAIPDEHLLKFHDVPDAKSLWAAIQSRFGGNEESKKMQKNILKHQFENFTTASNEKTTNNTNEVSTASGDFGVSTAAGTGSSSQVSLNPCVDEVMCSFFAQQTTNPLIDNKDVQQIHEDDLEELDLRWQLSATIVTEKGILLKNAGHEGIKEKGFMLIMEEGMNQQMNLHLKHCLSSSSDIEVQNCSKCSESFNTLKGNLDSERVAHNKAKLEIQGYELALESLESRILGHEKNELA
ncbi:hypothetical protein Tco_1346784 [Tanacetum coccineum]